MSSSVADIAVSVAHVTKRFVSHTERATSLKERVVRHGRKSHSTFDALRDVSIDVAMGESVGLMGANGSGKSTLLKVMAGIIQPNEGTVVTRGRIASLLELGAGFNGELSGRDNVYLNASLLGLTRKETDRLFDDIVDFSELHEFIDGPVKHYSSGMYVRLGFAVAVHVDPEILLIDEVLAVGDEHFQRKCLERISEFQSEGRTILFVSHSSALVERVCSRAVVLNHGATIFDGDPYFAAAELRGLLGTDVPTVRSDVTPDHELSFGPVQFSSTVGGPAQTDFEPGEPIIFRVHLNVGPHWVAELAVVRLVVMGVGDIPIWAMEADRRQLPDDPGQWALDFVVTNCPPIKGRFVIATQLETADGIEIGSSRTQHAFGVNATHTVGIYGVPFAVQSTIGSHV